MFPAVSTLSTISSLLHTVHTPPPTSIDPGPSPDTTIKKKEQVIRLIRYAIQHYEFCIGSSTNSVKRSSSSQRQDAVFSGWRERRKRTTDSSPKPI
jgi:hypothetical protein